MSPNVSLFLALLNSQAGAEYRFGAEAKPSQSNPAAFDCSELIEWACARLNVTPTVPDLASAQFRHCHNHPEAGGRIVPISVGLSTPGALLGIFPSDPLAGPTGTGHIAVSQGNGTTIEARSTRLGVGVFSTANRGWTHAAILPGITYGGPMAHVHWSQPSDGPARIQDLECVRNVHRWHGQTVMTLSDIAYDENDPAFLDERYKIVTARLLSEIMTVYEAIG